MEILDLPNHTFFSNLGTDCNSDQYKIPYFNHHLIENLSYNTFFSENAFKNVPCVIHSVTDLWECQQWIAHNKPNFDYLIEHFGDVSVPVADCGDRYYNAQKKEEQTLKQYLNYWKKYLCSNYSSEMPCLYLKDWHFTRDFPEKNIYRVPSVFASDWLNEYFTSREDVQDDYRFIYMGPKGSWTPFHADVFSSFSWSVNLCGQKRWLLYPPGQEKNLTDKHNNLAYDVEDPSLNDKDKFENYDKVGTRLEIIQNPGEAIFVPSGWHHQVWNLDDTISINHNWVNGCNIWNMWMSLRNNLAAVKAEISDCQDMEGWEEHCQIMLNAAFGLDYKLFCSFLMYIVQTRLTHLQENTHLKVYGNWYMGTNHLKFDIKQAKSILMKLISDADFNQLNYFVTVENEIGVLMEEIDTAMDRK
uniref:2-oxoglutarate and iron-dependent oxygenase JMJD4 n=1 Tax=Graphocephala atropunctata TaxID=36148 RepID=A0A1B6KL98_9HEMI